MKYIKWDINKVNKFVKENSDCELISETYKNVDTKMKFKCSCGNEFETSFDKFKGRNKRQCNPCGHKLSAERQKLPYEDVKHFIEVESKSGCKLISEEYKNTSDKLEVQCSCGNIYKVHWRHFKSSNQRQCPQCGIEIRAKARRLPHEEIVGEIESKGCKLLSEYRTVGGKIKLQCSCGGIFYTSYSLFRDYDVNMCSKCRTKTTLTSKGEDRVREWLDNNSIEYIEEYTSDGLKNTNKLRFDFAVINKEGNVKMLIEYDGRQHFGMGMFSDNTEQMIINHQRTLINDNKKNEHCFKYGIPLLRIPYNKYPEIDEILNNTLK